MAVMSADHAAFAVDGEVDSLILPLRAAAADIFYRGGLTWDSATGIIVTDPGDAILFRGVVAQRTTTLAANDRVRCYIFGHFKFACANFTIANEGAGFRGTGADGDNPTGLVITAPGADIGGRVGFLTTVETTATDGWLLAGPWAQD
jgi:hypothetical protein